MGFLRCIFLGREADPIPCSPVHDKKDKRLPAVKRVFKILGQIYYFDHDSACEFAFARFAAL